MKKIMLAAVVFAMFSACQKEIDFTSSTGSTSTSNPSANDYQPTTANSVWNYSSTSVGDYSMTAVGTDTTINSLKYHKFLNSISGVQYISKIGGVYRQFSSTSPAGGPVDLVYLKDAAAGTAWTSMIGNVEMRYSIAGTGLQRTVNSKQYSNVIKVKYEQYAMGMQTSISDQYYAKGVGPIENIIKFDFMGMQMTIDSTYLVSSNIK